MDPWSSEYSGRIKRLKSLVEGIGVVEWFQVWNTTTQMNIENQNPKNETKNQRREIKTSKLKEYKPNQHKTTIQNYKNQIAQRRPQNPDLWIWN